ncbi:hypothetical protein Rwratislav_38958 [Rhodococcus wratislaviensis IFP 2016]|nr:hypothetical protein Rwratislav_38958 [Rhodococcus wratislaviensis IFP 2016]
MFEGADRGATFGTLWATDARYLNDSEEVIYGTKIMVEELERQADASGQSPTVALSTRSGPTLSARVGPSRPLLVRV